MIITILITLPIAFMVFNMWIWMELVFNGNQQELAVKLLMFEAMLIVTLILFGALTYNYTGDLLGWIITTFLEI